VLKQFSPDIDVPLHQLVEQPELEHEDLFSLSEDEDEKDSAPIWLAQRPEEEEPTDTDESVPELDLEANSEDSSEDEEEFEDIRKFSDERPICPNDPSSMNVDMFSSALVELHRRFPVQKVF
jgi:hypothetical protein